MLPDGRLDEVQGLGQVGNHDNFLQLAGDSLIGVQLIARLRESFRIQLSVQRVVETPTVALRPLVAIGDEQEDLSQLENLLSEVEQTSQAEVQDELRGPGPIQAS